MGSNSKTAGCRVERVEIWESGVLVEYIRGTFDLLVFNVIWGSLSAFVLKWPVIWKWLAGELKGLFSVRFFEKKIEIKIVASGKVKNCASGY